MLFIRTCPSSFCCRRCGLCYLTIMMFASDFDLILITSFVCEAPLVYSLPSSSQLKRILLSYSSQFQKILLLSSSNEKSYRNLRIITFFSNLASSILVFGRAVLFRVIMATGIKQSVFNEAVYLFDKRKNGFSHLAYGICFQPSGCCRSSL